MRTRKFLSTLIPALPALLTALLVILVTVIFLAVMRSKAHAQFGGVEQPMFQMTSLECTFPQDPMTSYAALVTVEGLDGGCLWNGPYVIREGTNLPAIIHQDTMSTYSAGWGVTGLTNGINWFSAYVAKTYEDLQNLRYVDAFDERSAADDLIAASYGGGTNYFFSFTTNSPYITQAWTNGNYVAKGY